MITIVHTCLIPKCDVTKPADATILKHNAERLKPFSGPAVGDSGDNSSRYTVRYDASYPEGLASIQDLDLIGHSTHICSGVYTEPWLESEVDRLVVT